MNDKERVTISFGEGDEYLLEKIDELVDSGMYSDRTEAFKDSLRIQNIKRLERQRNLYDAAVTAFYSAEREGKYQIAQNAQEHIMENFSGSKMAALLEERKE